MRRLALLATTLFSVTAWASCPEPAGNSDLSSHLDRAEDAYAGLDVDAFSSALDQAALTLPCLEEPVDTGLAAWFHRMRGLRLYLEDDASAVAHFAAARAGAPDYRFPDTLIPAGHPVRLLHDDAVPTGGSERLGRPRHGELLLDGAPRRARYPSLPVIAQRVQPSGDLDTTYVEPGGRLPPYDAVPPHRGPRIALLSGGAAALAGGAVVLGSALSARAEFWEATDLESIERNKQRANTLAAASAGLGAVGLGLGIGGLVVGSF